MNKKEIMFDKFKVKKPQRSTFSLSHKHETTVNIGDINCLHWNWCFPGDRFKIKYSFLCKFAPMIAPNFSRMRIKSEVFYVPLADLYDHFHDVIMNYKEESSEEVANGQRTTFTFNQLPHLTINSLHFFLELQPELSNTQGNDWFACLGQHTFLQQAAVERLIHQMGVPFDCCRSQVPTFQSNGTLSFINNPYDKGTYTSDDIYSEDTYYYSVNGQIPISLLPFQAYQYVYNWFYRDSVRSNEIDVYPDVYSLQNNNTYALINQAVGSASAAFNAKRAENLVTQQASYLPPFCRFINNIFQVRRRFYRKDYFNTAVGDPTVGVDSIQVPDNIVDLRKANQLQKFIEKQALAGNRVAEFIMAHWAHKSDDYELGRPILISTSSQNVQISEVLQTSETTTDSAQGTRSGVGNSYGNSNGSYFVAPDYGILLINMSIVPEISYFSGVPRKLTPYRWEHFPWPEFAQIGMQPIYDFEIAPPYLADYHWSEQPVTLENQNVFGYAPRYSEFKMELDQVSGEMATSLRYWHQSPTWDVAPPLNNNFGIIGMIDYNQCFTPAQAHAASVQYYNQIFAVESDQMTDHCQVIGLFDISVNRALPYNDMPAL